MFYITLAMHQTTKLSQSSLRSGSICCVMWHVINHQSCMHTHTHAQVFA